MLDLKKILREKEEIEKILRKRNPSISLERVISLANSRKKLQQEYDYLRYRINRADNYLRNLDKTSKEFIENAERMREIKRQSMLVKKRLSEYENKLEEELLKLPNLIGENVPVSQRKEDKEILYYRGEKPNFDFEAVDHLTIGKRLDILDFRRASKISGPGFPLYKGMGAILEWALINYMIENSIKNGFEFMLFPLLNNTKSLISSGNLPKFAEEIYSCRRDDLHLVPTAEVPITNLYRDEVIDVNKLPIRISSYSPCFRREAGSYGALTKGLMRMHQFNKIETYSICTEDQAEGELKYLIKNGEEILMGLGLHFRLTNLPSCDLAQQSSQTYDIEVWLPSLKDYSEVSSASNCLDFQSRRANIRYRSDKGIKYVYTLNCSALATPRVMISLLETYQTRDKHIIIPEVLRKYTKFDRI